MLQPYNARTFLAVLRTQLHIHELNINLAAEVLSTCSFILNESLIPPLKTGWQRKWWILEDTSGRFLV